MCICGGLIAGSGTAASAQRTGRSGGARTVTGSAASFAPPAEWPEQLTRRWKVEVGLGYATPLVVGNRIYMFSRQGGDEVMSALDAATGAVLWKTGYPTSFTMNSGAARHGQGPESTPVFAKRPAVRDRHDGDRDRVRRRHRQAGLAETGIAGGPDLYHPCLLAAGGARPRDLPRGWAQSGRNHGVRRDHGRREVELEGRRARLWLAHRRGPGRHAADHCVDAGEARGSGRREREPAVGAAVREQQLHELRDSGARGAHGHRLERRTRHGGDPDEARQQVDEPRTRGRIPKCRSG